MVERRGDTQDLEKKKALEAEGKTLAERIATLRESTFVFRQTRCVACGLPLELPVTHFLCGHSFHKNCVAVDATGCPKCGCSEEKTKGVRDSEFLKRVRVLGGGDV